MNAISGTRRAMKELVDGTLRVQIDIEPRLKEFFYRLFPDIDMPVALAPLIPGYESMPREDRSAWKDLGPLAQSAILVCREPSFQKFVEYVTGADAAISEDKAAIYLKDRCDVASRKDLDAADGARERFGAVMSEYRIWREDHE